MQLPDLRLLVQWCSPCAAEQPFEMPECEDGHGEHCPDLCCVRCGHAVVVGGPLLAIEQSAARAA